jgi:hypothetical protein
MDYSALNLTIARPQIVRGDPLLAVAAVQNLQEFHINH